MKRFVTIRSCRPPRHHRQGVFPILVLTIFVISPAFGIASDQRVEVARQGLIKDWDHKFTRVETAQADFQQLFLMHVELRPHSRTDLLKMLERHRDFSAPDNRQAIADALCSDRLQGDQRGWFSQQLG